MTMIFARVERGIDIDRHYFQTLQGTITLPAIKLINQQWQLLITNERGKCTNQFRKQHLLPCAHDLQTTWSMGLPIPKSLVHPRWWLGGHILQNREWKPTYEPLQAVLPQPLQQPLQAGFHEVLEVRDRLKQPDQVIFDQQLQQLSGLVRAAGEAAVNRLPPLLPDLGARFVKAVPTVNERLQSEMRAQARAALQQDRDAKARALAAAESQGGTTITVDIEGQGLPQRPKDISPIYDIDDLNCSNDSSGDDLICIPDSPPPAPPASTAPTRSAGEQGRGKRARGRTLDYIKLDAGNSQEYKKARGSRY